MCGIAGFIKVGGFSEPEGYSELESMTDILTHRGPDSRGLWCDPAIGVGLGHRRLSILDLTSAGSQPMRSHSGYLTMVFNGEIYNHRKIRQEMPEVSWKSGSDTETLLEGIDRWGLKVILSKIVGMFAMAIWDSRTRKLILVRDRFGEKPLYYGWQGSTFLFASELTSISAHSDCRRELNTRVLPLMLSRGCVPVPYSIYRGILKLVPGSYVEIDISEGNFGAPVSKCFWSLHDVVRDRQNNAFQGTFNEAVDSVEHLLLSIVNDQKSADVPVGAFLSGGIDSSLIAALMQSVGGKNIKTFCIGFEHQSFNEAPYASEVARHLGCDHNEIILTSNDILEAIPIIADIFDEPFGDSSSIPTYLVSRLAKKQVTVTLSGDGGDEIFGGYSRYFNALEHWSRIRKIPFSLRSMLSSISCEIPAVTRRYPTLSASLRARSGLQFYSNLIDQWSESRSAVLSEGIVECNKLEPYLGGELTFIERARYYDTLTYLLDDVLVKLDRTAMAVSLEGRVPLLDHRLVEFIWKIPESVLLANGRPKALLKTLLNRYVPERLTERPKMGFGVPLGDLLRGALRPWAEDLLSEATLRRQGVFNMAAIRTRWKNHLNGRYDYRDSLWQVLMFQSWMSKMERNVAK